ncbi:MAG: hypothetical protein JXA33_12275 [Anaerolineae bacterium]|nr:hypothetical protein [Anaerolineae bacterium]
MIPKLESLDAQAWRKLIGSDIGDVSDSDWSLIQSVDDLCNEAWQKYLASNPSEDDHRCLIARLESLCDETLQKYWDNPGDDNLLQTFEHLTFVCGEAQSLLNGQTESWSWEERPL